MVSGHVGYGAERALQDQCPGTVLGGQVDRHGPAHGTPHHYNVLFRDPRALGEPRPGGAGVGQNTRLVGLPLAAAVAAVVEDQH